MIVIQDKYFKEQYPGSQNFFMREKPIHHTECKERSQCSHGQSTAINQLTVAIL
jgi:hypothetical protein